MQALNGILGKTSHLRVLRVLNRSDEPLTGREIQRRSGLSNRATMLALEELARLRVLLLEVDISKHLYTPNTDHYLWSKAVRPALDAEEQFWEDLRRTVRRIMKPRPIAAIVTGTLAREEPEEDRNLHLHLLYSTGRERLQSYRCLQKLRDRAELRYAMEVNATFMDLRNMDDPEYQALWRRIAKEGILLFGDLPVSE
jgi:hypothetical protein